MHTNLSLYDRFKMWMATRFIHPQSGFSGNGPGYYLLTPERHSDLKNVDPGDNSAVNAALQWIIRNFHQAQIRMIREDDENQKPVNHPAVDLLYRPNPAYSRHGLWAATLISYFLDGNAYWLKSRAGRGSLAALWYVPHWCIEPKWDLNGANYVSHYEYTANGQIFDVMPEDLIHFRQGIDPANIRKGYSPIKSALREILADEEAGIWAASLLTNMGIPGAMIIPDPNTVVTETSAESIKNQFQKRFTGSNRGKPMVLNFPGKVELMGFSPKDMALDIVRRIPETRITALLGVPAIVAGLAAGLDSSTYNNLAQLKRSAFEESLIPLWDVLEDELKRQLLSDFPMTDKLWIEFDKSKIPALQENESDRQTRARENYLAGGISRDEFRMEIGRRPLGQDFYLVRNGMNPTTPERLAALAAGEGQDNPLADPKPDDDGQEDPAKAGEKAFLWNGRRLGRKPKPEEEKVLEAVAAAQDSTRESTLAVMLDIRQGLLTAGLAALAGMDDDFHNMALDLNPAQKDKLRAVIVAGFQAGRETVINTGKKDPAAFRAYLETAASFEKGWLGDAIKKILAAASSALASAVKSRIVDEFSRRILRGEEKAQAVEDTGLVMRAESVAYVEALAAGTAYESVADGREDAIQAAAGPDDYFLYSAILDSNTCGICREADLAQSKQLEDLPPAPNPDCEGRWRCRCMIVIVHPEVSEPNPDL